MSEIEEQCAFLTENLADVESDDTLSDGGDFLEGETELQHLRPSMLQTSIPIVPATPVGVSRPNQSIN